MTGSPAPDPERRPLKSLLDQAPTPEPPDWLDANIRAAAHEAARGAAASRAAGERAAEAGRRRWRWVPIGAVVATAVLGVLIVMNQSRRTDETTRLAQAPTPSAVPATPPAAERAPERVPDRAPAGTASGIANGAAASRADAEADAAKPGPPLAHESKETAAGAPAAGEDERRKAASPAQAKREGEPSAAADAVERPASPATPPASAQRQLAARAAPQPSPTPTSAQETLAALPDTARGCVESVEAMRGEQRIDDARRRLRDCRTRYPDYPYPPELLRALPPPDAPPATPRTP